jgi:hypothetical protein
MTQSASPPFNKLRAVSHKGRDKIPHLPSESHHITAKTVGAVPWLKSLVAGLSPRRTGFAPGSIHVGFVVDKVALGQVFLRVLRFPLSISFHRRSPNSYHLANA